jgi:hypothetical protein
MMPVGRGHFSDRLSDTSHCGSRLVTLWLLLEKARELRGKRLEVDIVKCHLCSSQS